MTDFLQASLILTVLFALGVGVFFMVEMYVPNTSSNVGT
jgi:hypothetical protein